MLRGAVQVSRVAVVAASAAAHDDVGVFLAELHARRPDTVVFSDGLSCNYGGVGFDLQPVKRKGSWVVEVLKNRDGSGTVLEDVAFADKPSCLSFLRLKLLDLVDRLVVFQDEAGSFDPLMVEAAVGRDLPRHIYSPSVRFREAA